MNATLPPPRCLAALATSPAPAPEILLDGLTDWPNRFFTLRCRCDGDRFSVHGELSHHSLLDQDLLYGPITVKCSACEVSRDLFDPRLHGYDVELDHFPPKFEATANPDRFPCPACGAPLFTLIARFEYPAALIAALEAGNDTGYDERHRGAEQDLFTFFTLIGRCCNCAELVTVVSVECA